MRWTSAQARQCAAMQPRSMNSAVQVAWGGRDRETDTDRAEPRAASGESRAERSVDRRRTDGQRYRIFIVQVSRGF